MVTFDPILGTYTYEGRSYVRASSLYSYFKVPFDIVAQSIKYAKRHGGTPEYWQEKWTNYSKERADEGTKFHDWKESVVKDTKQYKYWDRTMAYGGERQEPDYYNNWPDGVYTEVKLWHHGLRIAGRADIVILETINGVRYMHIDDYKTCMQIDLRSYCDKNGTYRKMLPPVSHLEDCNYVHFQLQFSTYQLCGEFLGFRPGNRRILHYPQSNYGKVLDVNDFVKEPIIYNLPYLKKEVISMANQHHATLQR